MTHFYTSNFNKQFLYIYDTVKFIRDIILHNKYFLPTSYSQSVIKFWISMLYCF